MKIVAVADTHLYHKSLKVPDGDVFIHAGDMCQYGGLDELEQAATWIRSLPHRHKIVVAGNHDGPFLRQREEALALLGHEVFYLQDQLLELEGIRFWGSPWQPKFGGWAFGLERGADIAAKWALIPENIDVLITHGPPKGIGDRAKFSIHAGCQDLFERVEIVKPRVHLFGHIHQDGGAWQVGPTLFGNVTTWDCERGASVFSIDRDSATAIVVPPRDTSGFR